MLDSAFPYVLRANQFFEIDDRHHLQVLQQTEYPNHFLSRLAGQVIEKILNGAFPVHCCVEDDRSIHGCMLTHMLTFVKMILAGDLGDTLFIEPSCRFWPTIRRSDRKLIHS